MTLDTCATTVSSYLMQLRNDFDTTPTESGCLLSTPFVRPDGEGIEIEMSVSSDGQICLTDMGDTLGYLYVNGLTLSRKLLADARGIAKNHGVSLLRNELSTGVNINAIGPVLHEFIQAILSVTSLIHKRRSGFRVQFDDEVESLIIHSGVAYDVGYQVRGERESHTIKFHVNSGKNLLIHPLSAAKEAAARSWAERLSYRFSDIQKGDSQWYPIAVLDDRSLRSEVWSLRALTPVSEYALKWSQREELQTILKSTHSRKSNR